MEFFLENLIATLSENPKEKSLVQLSAFDINLELHDDGLVWVQV